MPMNIELRTDKEIDLFDLESKTRTTIRPYRRNGKTWVSIDAPRTIQINHQAQGERDNGQRTE